MSNKNDGGGAFPELESSCLDRRDDSMRYESTGGISVRAYFAAKALQGFCANPAVFSANNRCGWSLTNCTEEQLAEVCARLADVMIAELAK